LQAAALAKAQGSELFAGATASTSLFSKLSENLPVVAFRLLPWGASR